MAVLRSDTHPELEDTIGAGREPGCPFCVARVQTQFKRGECVQLLNGYHAGSKALVVEPVHYDELHIKFVDSQETSVRRSVLSVDLWTRLPLGNLPAWLAPLPTDDLAAVEDAIIQLAAVPTAETRRVRQQLLNLVDVVWTRRLPVRSADLRGTFQAHGLSALSHQTMFELFDFGLDQLVYSRGRKPNARKRMNAMSSGRYETKHQMMLRRMLSSGRAHLRKT